MSNLILPKSLNWISDKKTNDNEYIDPAVVWGRCGSGRIGKGVEANTEFDSGGWFF